MSAISFTPPYSPLPAALTQLRERGYALLAPSDVAQLARSTLADLQALQPSWNDLVDDSYLKDGGRYRKRRHSCMTLRAGSLQAVAHRAHWQPVEYNALHGGMQRWFEPMTDAVLQAPAWQQLVLGLGELCAQRMPTPQWFVEAHQFRIDTAGGIGRPTPEGAHRDGVDFVAVLLVGRHHIKGGETRVFEANGPSGQRFTLAEPWTLLLLDDARMIHESTPIQPTAEHGWRDTLVLTYRAQGFLGDDA
jgi:hypothetical protein